MITMKIDANTLNLKLQDLKQIKHLVMPQIEQFFISHTPIDTGNARSHTTLNGDVIIADYPYAERLDEGYSKQAPQGMSQPTIDYAKKIVPAMVQKLGSKR